MYLHLSWITETDTVYDVQEESTHINVRSYWPSVVASGAMLLATDAFSTERTLGSYMLSSCDLSKSEIAGFAYLQGSAELLMKFATTYDANVRRLLNERFLDNWLQRNLTALRKMILDEGFSETCNNMTDVQRTELIVEWAYDIQLYILSVDKLRGNRVLPSILRVIDLPVNGLSSSSPYSFGKNRYQKCIRSLIYWLRSTLGCLWKQARQ